MKKNILRLGYCLLLASSLFWSGCFGRKDVSITPEPETDIPGLPPKTQTGAETFGCMINGQPWTLGKTACFSCPRLVLDLSNLRLSPGILFNLRAQDEKFYVSVSAPISVNGLGEYTNGVGFFFSRRNDPSCSVASYEATYEQGKIVITRFDTQARIVSGTFEGAIYKPNCDTVKFTNGRFDVKF
jgi:hypothetical protein